MKRILTYFFIFFLTLTSPEISAQKKRQQGPSESAQKQLGSEQEMEKKRIKARGDAKWKRKKKEEENNKEASGRQLTGKKTKKFGFRKRKERK